MPAGFQTFTITISGSSLDIVTQNGFYDITRSTDNPYGSTYTAFMIVMANGTYIMQLAFRNGEADMKRWYWNDQWTQWT